MTTMNDDQNPSPVQWVVHLESVLRQDYMPAIMDEVRSRIGPLVKGVLDEMTPYIEHMVSREVTRQLNDEALRRVKVEIVDG